MLIKLADGNWVDQKMIVLNNGTIIDPLLIVGLRVTPGQAPVTEMRVKIARSYVVVVELRDGSTKPLVFPNQEKAEAYRDVLAKAVNAATDETRMEDAMKLLLKL